VAPARTPGAIVPQFNARHRAHPATPEMSARLAELGAEPASCKPDEFLAFIKRDNAKWDKLIRERKIEVERVTLAL
jgi:tripartite-type tricarboxylate transporter receptor subunit TctC